LLTDKDDIQRLYVHILAILFFETTHLTLVLPASSFRDALAGPDHPTRLHGEAAVKPGPNRGPVRPVQRQFT